MLISLKRRWAVVVMLMSMTVFISFHPLARQPSLGFSLQAPPSRQAVTPTASTASLEQAALTRYLAAKYEKPPALIHRIVAAAYREAAQLHLPPLLLLAIIEKESSMEPRSINTFGATGLMQIVPRFHRDKLRQVAHPDGLLNPEANIKIGTQILAEYIQEKKGDIDGALRKYSGNTRNYLLRVRAFTTELDHIRRTTAPTQPT